MMEKGIIIIPTMMYKTVDGIGYQRKGFGDKQQSLQEWFMNEVFATDFKVADWAAKVKEMTQHVDTKKSTGDLGFSGRYGYDGPGHGYDNMGQQNRGPFLYSVEQLGEKEIGRNPFTPEVRKEYEESDKQYQYALPSTDNIAIFSQK
jgi:hypothetical protein